MKYRTKITLANGKSSVRISSTTTVIPPVAANDAARGVRSDWSEDKVTIPTMPKPGEAFWFIPPRGAQAPEFSKAHPCVVLSSFGHFDDRTGTVVVVPLTSSAPREAFSQDGPSNMVKLSANPGPAKTIDVWAVCNQVTTLSLRRLERYTAERGPFTPKVSASDFDAIVDAVVDGLVALRGGIERRVRAGVLANVAADEQAHREAVEAVRREYEQREMDIIDAVTAPPRRG